MTKYFIKCRTSEYRRKYKMNDLRKKRLLILATSPSAWHKQYYSQYCELINHGFCGWVLGTAFLTKAGEDELKRLCKRKIKNDS